MKGLNQRKEVHVCPEPITLRLLFLNSLKVSGNFIFFFQKCLQSIDLGSRSWAAVAFSAALSATYIIFPT